MNESVKNTLAIYEFLPIDPEIATAMRKLSRLLLALHEVWDLAAEANEALDDLLDVPDYLYDAVKDMRDSSIAAHWGVGGLISGVEEFATPHVLALAGKLDGTMAAKAIAALGQPETDKRDFPTAFETFDPDKARAEAVPA